MRAHRSSQQGGAALDEEVRWGARGAGALTLRVTKKYSPGESCRKRTPVEATGASKNLTSWLAYAKQSKMQAPTAPTLIKTRWRSSSRWSHTLISTSSGSSSLSGNRNVCSGDAASRSRRVVAGRYVSSQKSGGSSAPPTTSAAEADTARAPSAQEIHRGGPARSGHAEQKAPKRAWSFICSTRHTGVKIL
jgi:hypothetical protein